MSTSGVQVRDAMANGLRDSNMAGDDHGNGFNGSMPDSTDRAKIRAMFDQVK